MSDMNFRDKLDLEMKNVVFTDKSRKKVLEQAALHGGAAGRRKAVPYGNAGIRGGAASYNDAVGCGSADGNGRTTSRDRAALCGNTALSGRRAPGVKIWRERFQSFMNLELRIPVKPLVVALLITVSGIIYACVGITRVSAEDIRNSSIAVVDSNRGGQADGIYKN